jgi:hypothetical protein
VEGESTCRISQDSARTVATLWDQARGVLAASTMNTGGDYLSTLVRYRNVVPIATHRVADEAVQVVQTLGANGFVSLSADSLATQGFIVTAGNRAEFRAPDANVLLSPAFAASHCFRVVPPPRGHPGWVGIAFEPAQRRRDYGDIRGNFWLDRLSSELQRLDFTYLNVPSNMRRDDAEGSVEFAKLGTGDWIVSRWAIHTPVTDPGSRRMPGMPDTLIGIATAGGITRSVVRDSVVLHEDYRGAVTFRLSAADSLNPTYDAVASIASSDRSGTVDSTGQVVFTNVPAGKYTFKFRTPLMEWIGAKALEVELDITDSTDAVHEVTMPGAGQVMIDACEGFPIVFGFVVGDSGQGVPFAQVEIESRRTERLDIGRSAIERLVPVTRTVRADGNGRWRTCQPPGHATFVAREGRTTGIRQERFVPPTLGLVRVDLVAPEPRRP